MKVGFTGTQRGMTQNQKNLLHHVLKHELNIPMTEFHHGDCIGADQEAHFIVSAYFPQTKIHVHPPNNDTKRAFMRGDTIYPNNKDYIQRNREIVVATDILIATPKQMEEQIRSGTWSTVRFAKGIGKTVVVIWPAIDEVTVYMPH